MRFSLIEKPKLHTEKLIHEIEIYQEIFLKNPYIFMNQNTIDEFINMNIRVLNFTNLESKAEFHGCKVYCDNELDYGEIELR